MGIRGGKRIRSQTRTFLAPFKSLDLKVNKKFVMTVTRAMLDNRRVQEVKNRFHFVLRF